MSQNTPFRELILLRHAKSSWENDAANDFARPLNRRGERDAPRIGNWLRDQGFYPDLILASPAERAKQTILAVSEAMEGKPEQIVWERGIYEANISTLLEVIRGISDDARRVLLVGHNPGLESLALYLIGPGAELEYGFMKTATVVRIAMPSHWIDVGQNSGKLLQVMQPRELA